MTTLADGLPEFRPTFLLAVPRVFEKVCHGAQRQASASRARARIFAAAAETAIAWSKAINGGPAGGPGPVLRLPHALSGRLVYGRLRAVVGGRVQYAVCGGAPLGERLGHFFRAAGITVLEGYGLAECSAAATVNKPGRNKIGTVGQPVPGVTIRIADDGEILPRAGLSSPGTGTTRLRRPGRWTIRAGCTAVISARWTTRASCGLRVTEIQLAVDDANKAASRAESIRRFRVLDSDLTEASGQLTPSTKVRRNVVAKDFAADIDALYSPLGSYHS